MNKSIFSIYLLALIAVGCNQVELIDPHQANESSRTFTASFDQRETRTYVEEGNLLRWTAGDQISLFDGNTLNRQYQFDGETGDNSGTFSIVDAPYGSGNDLTANYAVYPYASDMKITENGVITATLPAKQTYAENSFGLGANTMVAVTKDKSDTFLRFKNVCGYLKLQLYGENITVKSITLTGNNNEKIAGKATIITAYNSQTPTIVMSDDATTNITLDCGEGVQIGTTVEAATAFWFVVPTTTFESGFEVPITDINGGTFTKSTSKEIAVERNVIKPMTAFEVEIETIPNNQIWYTSSDGNIVMPNNVNAFGAAIESNVYANGKGVITFAGDITTIGENAFAACYSLTNIMLPNSVTTIKRCAFIGCQSLTDIVIPDSVTDIENAVFVACMNLKEFKGKFVADDGRCLIKDNAIIAYANASGTEYTIPDNVTTVWNGAFAFCSSLTRIKVPDNVTTIQPASFVCPNLKTINGRYATDDGRFYIIDGAIKIFAPSGLSECVIPDDVTKIEYQTFMSVPFTNLTIPESVTEISYDALVNCFNLTSIYCKAATPPTAVFNYNYWNAFPTVTIYVPVDSVLEYRKAAGWKNYAENIVAYDYDKGESVISDNIIYYTSSDGKIVEPYDADEFGAKIISNTYENGLGVIEFDSDVISIGHQAFRDCSKLTSITIPDSVIEIEPLAFYNCYSLEKFKGCYASDDGSCLVVDGMLAAYAEDSGTEYTIPNNVKEIGGHVFDGFNDLTHIDIPDGVTTIGYSAFQSCSSLTSITIPDSVTDIQSQAFIWCYALKNVTIGNGVKIIGQFAFSGCPISSLAIPDNVIEISRGAFQYCSSLSDLTISNGLNEIAYEAFNGCGSLTKVTIPESVTKIGNNAFLNCGSLISLYCESEIPPKATYWYGVNNWKAFDNNASGRKIYVPRGSGNAYKSAEGWSNYASDIVEYDF